MPRKQQVKCHISELRYNTCILSLEILLFWKMNKALFIFKKTLPWDAGQKYIHFSISDWESCWIGIMQ